MALGYVCMNRQLRQLDEPLRCNRTIQKKTWESEGLERASEVSLQNVCDLVEILKWNVEQDIQFYRCSSMLFTWNSEYDLRELPDWSEISSKLVEAGRIVRENDMRFSFHPAQWCALASPTESTRENAAEDLNNHAAWMDAMGLPQTPEYPINIHVGGYYGDKEATAERWIENWKKLDTGARRRLTIENDDGVNEWSVSELVETIGEYVPVTFDYHHHSFSGEISYRDAFELAKETWPCRPVTHYSEPACLWGSDKNPVSHSHIVSDMPRWLAEESDVMLEAGSKEGAIFWIRKHRPDLTRINS